MKDIHSNPKEFLILLLERFEYSRKTMYSFEGAFVVLFIAFIKSHSSPRH